MNLICFYNSEEPVYSVTEETENFCVYILDQISKGINKRDFDNKIYKLIDGRFVAEDYKVPLTVPSVPDSLEPITENAKNYQRTFCFDKYNLYEVNNGVFSKLRIDKEIFICKDCGKIMLSQNFNGYCEDCFINNHMPELSQESARESYTEYEKYSKIFDVIDSFINSIKLFSTQSERISNKAKEIIQDYLDKERIEDKYKKSFLGGL